MFYSDPIRRILYHLHMGLSNGITSAPNVSCFASTNVASRATISICRFANFSFRANSLVYFQVAPSRKHLWRLNGKLKKRNGLGERRHFWRSRQEILSPCLDIKFSSVPYLCKFKIIFSHKSAAWNDTVPTAWHMPVERLRWTNPRHRHLLLHYLRGRVVAKNKLVNEIKFTVWLFRAHHFSLTRYCEWIIFHSATKVHREQKFL